MKELVGKKIRLIKMVWHTPIAPGTTGRVTRIDGIGLMHIRWDRKRGVILPDKGLCVDPDIDQFEVL